VKRAVRIVVLFLLLGAAINVAVAWGCALWSPWPAMSRMDQAGRLPSDLFANVDVARWPELEGVSYRAAFSQSRSSRWGVTMHQLDVGIYYFGRLGLEDRLRLSACQAGWPLRALQTVTPAAGWKPDTPARTLVPAGWESGVHVPESLRARDWSPHSEHGTPHPLPLRPLWPGFAINAVLYGSAMWLLLSPVRGRLRRWRRVRRGLCLECGYPVRGLGKCPECGVALVSGAHPHGLPALDVCCGAA
jgi:hypothetical protein